MIDPNVKSEGEEATELLLTKAEAIALVKRSAREKGSRWLLMIPLDARVLNEPDKIFSQGCYTSLLLSRASAEEVFKNMHLEVLEERGARIRVRETKFFGGCLGSRTQYMIH